MIVHSNDSVDLSVSILITRLEKGLRQIEIYQNQNFEFVWVFIQVQKIFKSSSFLSCPGLRISLVLNPDQGSHRNRVDN